ncbi:2-phytyl-1,4-beta-naphthoquinone methyltransferase, chloroplastic-like isoform X2 [Vitis riparia]|uniref:2-phytyl-1,4-beta-naphthoquinone methyltransferase, chloroplastic-like isoform X2 n=1 Tax=Vitis riparia TaxID=96939 RepID=UPI00155B0F92|nr:2-phytyl-1,4-beta-naphthoquinone methyltransferase, chloroplastic-like isoform X2 [Vitis riparia]
MASLQFLLRPSSNPNLLALPSRSRSVRCADERQALFNRIAPVYDNPIDFLSLGQHRIWKRMAVSWSGAKRGDNVLDLCCGSGDLAFLLSERVGSDGKILISQGSDYRLLHLNNTCSQKLATRTLSGLRAMQLSCLFLTVLLMPLPWVMGYEMC